MTLVGANTLASQAKGVDFLVGPALLVCLPVFVYSLTVPLLATRAFFSHNEIVLARIAYDLFFYDKFLFAIVFVFGVIFPFVKLVLSIACWFYLDVRRAGLYAHPLVVLGRLSMLDVMLLALFVIGFKGFGMGTVAVRYGLYIYSGVVILSLLLSLCMEAQLRKAGPPGR
jgi:paraquat-inducible protein A